MLPLLTVHRRSAGHVTILELHGRLIVDEGDRFFREQVTSLVLSGRRHLLVDLSHVTSVDSGGVGALVAMYLHVTGRGGQLKLLCPSDRSCRVLRMTRLFDVFEIFDSEQDALRTFDAPAHVAS